MISIIHLQEVKPSKKNNVMKYQLAKSATSDLRPLTLIL
jgi:hypothetical protein